jgi:NAD(P)-dependent dehydrogenase (short-subunit alcohol dehydrogenase family)
MSQVVLVTGCRSGFGLLSAVELARRGHVVYAGLRDPAAADALRAATAGLSVFPVALDVTQATQRDAAVERILDEQGRIDALVNNAGVALGGFLEQVAEDEFRQVLDTNVIGPWALTKAVLPAMRLRRSGKIIMVGSMSGRIGLPGVGVYAASKWALEGMSESWRHELALFGIELTLVEPAQFKTDIFGRNRRIARGADDPDSPWAPYVRSLDRSVRAMVERSAGDPVQVARLITRLVEAKRSRLRHPIGPNAWMRSVLGRYVPFGLTQRFIARWLVPDPA